MQNFSFDWNDDENKNEKWSWKTKAYFLSAERFKQGLMEKISINALSQTISKQYFEEKCIFSQKCDKFHYMTI